jgi:alpha-tubulin suppressor-like RCC1 family protein
LEANFTSATTVPVTAAAYTAAGSTVHLALAFVPLVGTSLTVVNNTGAQPIAGTFDNLAHGQEIALSYGGVSYPFVANYHGGSGNDLVLHWANTRVLGWGSNDEGQIGDGSRLTRLLPVPVDQTGVLRGKTVIAVEGGSKHSLALCADGTLAAWGYNYWGQLGNGTNSNSLVPVAVDQSGVLAGKQVIAVAADSEFSLALCSDGTLAAWGQNFFGQLGDGTQTHRNVPVLVDRSGVLAGRRVVAIAAGGNSGFVVCADGSAAGWGAYPGNNSINSNSVPVLVDRSGVLAGKTVTAIAVGSGHRLVLCADGTLASWGSNDLGALGNGTSTNSLVPVLVNRSGVLSGKTVTAIAAGDGHSLVRCSDNTLAAWGFNNQGQLGNNTTINSGVPVLVNRSGVLAGKRIAGISAGISNNLVVCTDGAMAAWGAGSTLGNGTGTSSPVPVLVNTSALRPGERPLAGEASDGGCELIIVASPPPALVTTLAATDVTDTGATLRGTVNPNGSAATVSFQYGTTTAYGSSSVATPSPVNGTEVTAASATLGPLASGTTYHFRIVASSSGGTVRGEDQTFTTSTAACLSDLVPGHGTLLPAFDMNVTRYSLAVPPAVTGITLAPVVFTPGAMVTIGGVPVVSGATGGPFALGMGNNRLDVAVAAPGGANVKTYTVMVTRLPSVYQFDSAASVPVTVDDFLATGQSATFGLNFAPVPGTNLTVVENTGLHPLQGAFENLAQGQMIGLVHEGATYPFVADYYGGTGNDLVLRWANVGLTDWGNNSNGQLGNGGTTNAQTPVPVTQTGVLKGKTITTIAAGENHTLALCLDGSLGAWGQNLDYQLGNNGSADSSVPVLVDRTGPLAGRTIAAIAVGNEHNLALCADGTLAAWGYNVDGQLGNGTYESASVPVAVTRTGVLAGKVIAAVAAGHRHSLVLCLDGTLAAWGNNSAGQMGDGSVGYWRNLPVLADQSGVLAGRKVTAIAAGGYHNLALCSDGALAAWGSDYTGQLGNGTAGSSAVPTLVDRTGVLAGKTISAIAAGGGHSLALCTDGTLAAWGSNDYGQLGNNGTANSQVPVLVNRSGLLAGQMIKAIAAGTSHSLALATDGTVVTWGRNNSGQLGNNSTANASSPVAVDARALAPGARFMAVAGGASHSIGMLAMPPAPAVVTTAAAAITASGATLNGTINAAGGSVGVAFEYGLTDSYGGSATAIPATVSGATMTPVSAVIDGLIPGATYHFRAVATGPSGTSYGADLSFTTNLPPVFAGYAVSTAWQTAVNVSVRKLLARASDPDGDALAVTGAGPVSARGGTVQLQDTGMLFTPAADWSGPDSFPVTITDARGATVVGVVTVTVGPPPEGGGPGSQLTNPPVLTPMSDGRIGLKFQGIPGRSYQIQRSTDLTVWVSLANVTAGPTGAIVHVDEQPPQPDAFYRLAIP